MLEFDEDDWYISRTDPEFVAAQLEAAAAEADAQEKDSTVVLESAHPYPDNANDTLTLR